jgi:hypothetical protein
MYVHSLDYRTTIISVLLINTYIDDHDDYDNDGDGDDDDSC